MLSWLWFCIVYVFILCKKKKKLKYELPGKSFFVVLVDPTEIQICFLKMQNLYHCAQFVVGCRALDNIFGKTIIHVINCMHVLKYTCTLDFVRTFCGGISCWYRKTKPPQLLSPLLNRY